MKFSTSNFDNYRKGNISDTTVCVGVGWETPEDFRNNEMKNFIYTPRSILRAKNISEETVENYYKHIDECCRKLGFCNLLDYFGQMSSHFQKQGFDVICFLSDEEDNEYSVPNVLIGWLKTNGFIEDRCIKENDTVLF